MTSDRKIQANRANARLSKGTKTPHGRGRSAKNAFRHGLSLPIQFDPAFSDVVQRLAHQIAGPGADAERQGLARGIAVAQIDLRRVRNARYQLLSQALSDPGYFSEAMANKGFKLILQCLRPDGPSATMPDDAIECMRSRPEGPEKFAAILSEQGSEIDDHGPV